MDVSHKDYLISAFPQVLGVVTLLVCLLTEVSIFASDRHGAMYLVPLCSILLLYGHRRHAGTTSISEGPKGRPEGGEWEPIKNSCKLKLRLSPKVHAQP